jgi:Tfp pilus assembly protein PilE
MKRNNASHQRRSSGFTLFEVILAMGLTTLLLAAIYSALDLYWKYTTIGHQQVERAQIARAVFQKITHDLHCVTFAQKTTEEESTDSSEEETEVVEIQVTNPDDAYTAGNIGVFGDAQSLVLHTSRPARQPMLKAIYYPFPISWPPPVRQDYRESLAIVFAILPAWVIRYRGWLVSKETG